MEERVARSDGHPLVDRELGRIRPRPPREVARLGVTGDACLSRGERNSIKHGARKMSGLFQRDNWHAAARDATNSAKARGDRKTGA